MTEPNTSNEVSKKEIYVYTETIDLWDNKETIYTDKTGAFSIAAHSGARYIMVMVIMDANTILVFPIKIGQAKN